MIIKQAPREHFTWLWRMSRCPLATDMRAIEAVTDDGEIVGMVGYTNWTKTSVQMHVSLKYPVRGLLRAAFHYPFMEIGVSTILGMTGILSAARLCRHLGFREVYRLKDGQEPGKDLILFELRRDEWINMRKAA